MRRRLESGSSLIEVLTVIVVFLVGILALVQAFPTGLNLLRTTRSNTLAATLARAEMQRLQSAPDVLPEMVVPVSYRAQGTVIEVNSNTPWNDLLPPFDPSGGLLNSDGQIEVGGEELGRWDRIAGSNKFNRIIGEGRPIPAPRNVGGHFGGLFSLQFGPIYYQREVGTGVSVPGILSVYANDLVRRIGDPSSGRPSLNRRGQEFEFYFVGGEDAEDDPFAGVDQVWVPKPIDQFGNPIRTPLRLRFAFTSTAGGRPSQHEVIVLVDPDTAPATVLTETPNWLIINLRTAVAQPGPFGASGFDPNDFQAADGGSVRVQRVFREIPLAQAFNTGNPYEFKALNEGFGSLLINPNASRFRLQAAQGALVPLEARVDYTVRDWRIIRDGFRIPTATSWPSVRLALSSLKVMSTPATDGQQFTGLGVEPPNAENLVQAQDFALVDDETGGIILGNFPGGTYNSYFVDKRNGVITFIDRDATAAGVQVYLSVPANGGGWDTPALVDASNRSVRALYMANGEWSTQLHKASSSYRLTSFLGASGLQAGEAMIGGVTTGDENKIYFPISDLGHRVIINEIHYVDDAMQAGVLRDQEFRIGGTEVLGGVTLAYLDITSKAGAGAVFNSFRTGFAVKGVKGASIRVRVLWNPDRFAILIDPADNFNQMEAWSRQTRRVETEGFLVGGGN